MKKSIIKIYGFIPTFYLYFKGYKRFFLDFSPDNGKIICFLKYQGFNLHCEYGYAWYDKDLGYKYFINNKKIDKIDFFLEKIKSL